MRRRRRSERRGLVSPRGHSLGFLLLLLLLLLCLPRSKLTGEHFTEAAGKSHAREACGLHRRFSSVIFQGISASATEIEPDPLLPFPLFFFFSSFFLPFFLSFLITESILGARCSVLDLNVFRGKTKIRPSVRVRIELASAVMQRDAATSARQKGAIPESGSPVAEKKKTKKERARRSGGRVEGRGAEKRRWHSPPPPSRPHLATGGDSRGPNAAQCPIIRLTGLSCPRWGTMISPGGSGGLGVLLSRSVFF